MAPNKNMFGIVRIATILVFCALAFAPSASAQSTRQKAPTTNTNPGQLIATKNNINCSMTTSRSVWASSTKIFLGCADGSLYVLSRNEAANFPVIDHRHMDSGITAIRGDSNYLFITTVDGTLLKYNHAADVLVTFNASRTLSSFRLATLEVYDNKIYVLAGQGGLAVDSRNIYASVLNEGDVVYEIDPSTLAVTRTYDVDDYFGRTVVLSRSTGVLVSTIANPLDMWGNVGFPTLYAGNNKLFQTLTFSMSMNMISGTKATKISVPWANTVIGYDTGFVVGTEAGSIYTLDLKGAKKTEINLPFATNWTQAEAIEIRSVWTDSHDDLIFAGSSWGNDQLRTEFGSQLPAFFILRRS
jgi:hypothetical protein